MNKTVKALWVEALRSGKYWKQTRRLRRGNNFCCLGVLCDLAQEHGIGKWGGSNGENFDEQNVLLPESVREWAGLEDPEGDAVEIDGAKLALARHNDTGYTFPTIADAIESQL